MATSAPSIALDNTNDTTFRAWTQALSTAFQAVGLVKTADTGQINFATVLKPTTSNTTAGYEIYRLNDSLQSTRPVFFKFAYGCSSPNTYPMINISMGTSTDGAGNINSALTNGVRSIIPSTTNTTSNPCYFSGDGSYLTMVLPVASFALALCVDRTRDASGVATSDGVYMLGCAPAVSTFESVFSFSPGTYLNATTPTFAVSGGGWASSVVGADTYYYPHVLALPKFCYDLAVMAAYSADVVNLTPVSVTNCGASHTYLPFTLATPANLGTLVSLMRYE